MNFADVKEWRIPEGDVIRVTDSQNRVIWQKETGPDYTEPFYFENTTDQSQSVRFMRSSSDAAVFDVYESYDGNTWVKSFTTDTGFNILIYAHSKMWIRAETTTWNGITITGCTKVGGNIMSLLYGSNFTGQRSFNTTTEKTFRSLFMHNTTLTDASELLLPNNVNNYCYDAMFYECTALTEAPALPATTLADYCYHDMFYECTALTTAPDLPATTLAAHCYDEMFIFCDSLTQAPALPATTLADYCYDEMFSFCTSLTQAPALPATTLAVCCYQNMFEECTSLTQAPALPATTLAVGCYSEMFRYCRSLTTAPTLPATALVQGCYYHMFRYCTLLNKVTCYATSGIMTDYSTTSWLEGVSSTGTFYKKTRATWPTGTSGIPSGWTVVNV